MCYARQRIIACTAHSRAHLAFCCIIGLLSFCALSPVQRMYIALPEVAARTQMFKIHLGDMPNALTQPGYPSIETILLAVRAARVHPAAGGGGADADVQDPPGRHAQRAHAARV